MAATQSRTYRCLRVGAVMLAAAFRVFAAPLAAAPLAQDAPGTSSPAQLDQMLREGFELLDDGDTGAALAALQKTVVRASNDDLPILEARTLALRARRLDELLAETRLAQALERARGRAFEIRFSTHYERRALGRALEREILARLHREIGGRTLLDWSDPDRLPDALPPQARELERHGRLTAALLSARLRHDPWLGDLPAERKQQVELRERLTRFAAHVGGLPGFTSLGQELTPDDPTRATALRIAEEHRAATQPSSAPAESEAEMPNHEPVPPWPRNRGRP